MTREYTQKVDKLEAADAERQKEGENTEHKPMMMQEPQLMLTAGPASYPYAAAPQYAAAGVGVPPGSVPSYPPNMSYHQGNRNIWLSENPYLYRNFLISFQAMVCRWVLIDLIKLVLET